MLRRLIRPKYLDICFKTAFGLFIVLHILTDSRLVKRQLLKEAASLPDFPL